MSYLLNSRPNGMARAIIISILALIAVCFICSCSPQVRLNNLARKHPELFKRDTIFRSDTTFIAGVEHDTIVRYGITKDTLIIRDKQLTYKYYTDGKTVYLKGKCAPDTVVKMVPYIINNAKITATRWSDRIKLWIVDNIAWIVLIGMFVYWILKKVLKLTFLP
jgi:hypothetical protein